MQHANCVNGHWFWPFGVLIGFVFIITFSRFWWWGRRGNGRYYWQGRASQDDALATLDLRYAKGDISKAEYHNIRRALKNIDHEE